MRLIRSGTFVCICFLVSCLGSGTSGGLSFHWSAAADRLFRDTAKINPAFDSLRKELSLATADTIAIGLVNKMAEQSRGKAEKLFADEALLRSAQVGYTHGYAEALFEKGVYFKRESEYDSAFYYYTKGKELAKQKKFYDVQGRCMSRQGEIYYLRDNDSAAFDLFNQAFIVAQIAGDKANMAFCMSHIGEVYRMDDKYVQALSSYEKAVEIAKSVNDNDQVGYCSGAMGDVYRAQGNFPKALEFYQQSVSIAKLKNDKYEMSYGLSSMGDAYRLQQDYDRALDYYSKALDYSKDLNDKSSISYCLSSMGDIYRMKNDFPDALSTMKESLKVAKETGDKTQLADCLSTIGVVYEMNGDYDSALAYLHYSLDTAMRIQDYNTAAYCLRSMADVFYKTGNTGQAQVFAEQALVMAKKTHMPSNMKGTADILWKIYEKKGDYKTALEMHKLYIQMRDSINSNEQVKKFAAVEYSAKENELKAEQEKRDAAFRADQLKNEEEIKRQRTIGYAVTAGLVLVLLLALVIFRSLRQSRKDKAAISQQKQLVEEKQKEILDSITYAKRLQSAILPPVKSLEQVFPRSFILYLPKDIVAGDFYFLENTPSHVFIAAADCTGHGVPGAMVSVVCSNALTRAVKEFSLSEPGKILDKVRELVVETFEKSEDEVKDGMDISLLALEKSSGKFSWAGAHNPFWFFRGGKIEEIKADKQPVGKMDTSKPFTTHAIIPAPGDIFYLFTDGYADQFGGPKGKKFRYKQLEELLVSIAPLPAEEQKNKLHETFLQWKGNLEQVDDVCVIGICVD